MSQTDPGKGKNIKPEQVEAEFEPAPNHSESIDDFNTPENKTKIKSAWLKTSVFVVIAGLVGGASGYGISQIWPNLASRNTNSIITRLDELEGQLIELNQRTNTIEPTLNALEKEQKRPETANNQMSFDALQTKLSKLETDLTSLAKGYNDTLSLAKLTQVDLENHQKEHLQRPLPSVRERAPSQGEALQEQIKTLDQRITALNSNNNNFANTLKKVAQKLANLESLTKDLSGINGKAATPSANVFALHEERLALFVKLKDAAAQSKPFEKELNNLLNAWPEAPKTQNLVQFARSGVPNIDLLMDSFPRAEFRESTGEVKTYFGAITLDRDTKNSASVKIQSALADGAFNDVSAIILGLGLKTGDLLKDWHRHLLARQSLDESLEILSGSLNQPAEAAQ